MHISSLEGYDTRSGFNQWFSLAQMHSEGSAKNNSALLAFLFWWTSSIKSNSFWSSLSTLGTNFAQIFHIFSSSQIIVCTVPILTSNCALIVSVDTRRSLYMKFFIWPINSGVLTSLLLPHLSSSLTDPLPSLNLLCYSKTDAQFMQDAPKVVWSILYVSLAFFPSLKQNFIAYHSSKVSSRPDCIFEIHQLWQSGFSRVYSNCCCSCSFEPEIINIGQSSYKMYSNNILNFQESTILNACTKKVWKLIEGPSYKFQSRNQCYSFLQSSSEINIHRPVFK